MKRLSALIILLKLLLELHLFLVLPGITEGRKTGLERREAAFDVAVEALQFFREPSHPFRIHDCLSHKMNKPCLASAGSNMRPKPPRVYPKGVTGSLQNSRFWTGAIECGVRSAECGVRSATLDVRRSAFDVRRSGFDVRRSTFGVRRSAFGLCLPRLGVVSIPWARVRTRSQNRSQGGLPVLICVVLGCVVLGVIALMLLRNRGGGQPLPQHAPERTAGAGTADELDTAEATMGSAEAPVTPRNTVPIRRNAGAPSSKPEAAMPGTAAASRSRD